MSKKSSLPFEVVDTEKPGKGSRSAMKRLTVLVKPERVDSVISALRGMHLEAVIYDVKSAGKEKERVTTGRGMGTMEVAYVSRKIIATVVDPGRVDDVADAIKDALGGESKAVVVVSPVDGLVQI
jgi:nitrogen regulatory protein PII